MTTDQWLGQVGMYLAYLAEGWRGIALLRFALMTALVGLVTWSAIARATRPLAIVLGVLPALLLTRPIAVDRPELAGFVFLALLLVLLAAGRAGSDRALAATVGLVLAWTNVHGSFALGVALTVVACVEGALSDPARRRAYALCAVAAVAATIANPAGVGVWGAPGAHLLSPPRAIQEWSVIDVRTPLGLAYAATLAALIAAALLGPRVARSDIAILLPVALLSLTAARQAPLLAIAAAPLFADRAEMLLARLPRGAMSGAADRVALAAAAVVLVFGALATPGAPDTRAYPVAALTSIPTGDGVLARYEWGGWLIWSDVPVFVDGRLVPYRGAVLEDYAHVLSAAPGWRDIVARRGVRALLVAPTDPVASRAVDLGWSIRTRTSEALLIDVP